jgi:hypothetical protein
MPDSVKAAALNPTDAGGARSWVALRHLLSALGEDLNHKLLRTPPHGGDLNDAEKT